MSEKTRKPAYANRIQKVDSSAVKEILRLASASNTISFGGGLPAPESFPIDKIAEVTNELLMNNGPLVMQYSSSEGIPELRQKLLDRCEKHLGIKNQSIENIVFTNGSQQGLDLVAKVFINEGDVVFVEEPTYLAAIMAFQPYEPKIVGIATDNDGVIPDDLKAKLEEYPQAKLIYLIPDFQNPSGRTMTAERRKEILEIVKDYDIMILEDNPYGELRYTGEFVPPIKAFDEDEKVLYMSTFSKVLAPGLRLGWVIGDADVLSNIISAKQASDLQCNTLSQYICNSYLEKYDLDDHIAKINELYGHRHDVMLKALDENFPAEVTWTRPEGGLFLWMIFPDDVDTTELLKVCLKHGVAYVPGAPFFANDVMNNTCRINYSYVDDDTIVRGVKAMADAYREYRG